MPEALELVEDDEVRLKGLHARRGEQAAELADQRVTPSRLVVGNPGAGPAELVTQRVEAFADRRMAISGFLGAAVIECPRELVGDARIDLRAVERLKAVAKVV